MIIGKFTATKDGYSGRLASLLLDAECCIVPAVPGGDKAPDWRVIIGLNADGVEIGAGWNHEGKRAGKYIGIQIDDPGLARPLRANLIQSSEDKSCYHLLWSRASARTPK